MTLTSYEPSLRDRLAWFVGDMFGDNRTMRNWAQDRVRTGVDFVPVVGDAVGFDDAKADFDAGNYGQAAVGAGLSAVGSVPGVGDLAAAGLKAGGSALGAAFGPMSKKWHEMYHASASPKYFERPKGGLGDAGLHVTRHPAINSAYFGVTGEHELSDVVGGRVYPLLVDPGNVYKGPRHVKEEGILGQRVNNIPADAFEWGRPFSVARAIKESHVEPYPFKKPGFPSNEDLADAKWKPYVDEDTRNIVDDLYSAGEETNHNAVQDAFTKRGYDSILYSHHDAFDDDLRSAMMLFDDNRAIPKFSNRGLEITRSGNYSPAVRRTPDEFNFQMDELGEALSDGFYDEPELLDPGNWEALNETLSEYAKDPDKLRRYLEMLRGEP